MTTIASTDYAALGLAQQQPARSTTLGQADSCC